jgi:preprotein translocase subunit SecA
MNKQREVMYAERMKVIKKADVHEEIVNLFPDYITYLVNTVIDNQNKPDTWDLDALNKLMVS